MRLSTHFVLDEFMCPCGCSMPAPVLDNVRRLAKNLEFGVRGGHKLVKVTSGYRCAEHNAEIGGAKYSKHIDGIAADIKVLKEDGTWRPATELRGWVEAQIWNGLMVEGGIGLYSEYPFMLHYDIRGKHTRWIR